MIKTSILGFPRIGRNRELKVALEQYWKEETTICKLIDTGRDLREQHWKLHKERGIDFIPSNDFSFYDHVLDTSVMVGNVPDRFEWPGGHIDMELYFAMARGLQSGKGNVAPLEMTKWFDTNYHYLVPEFKSNQSFELYSLKPLDEFEEAKRIGIHTRPVLLGPVSYLLLGRMNGERRMEQLNLLNALLPVYEDVLSRLADAGADHIQLDEPCLAWDYNCRIDEALRNAGDRLSRLDPGMKLQITTYFDGIEAYFKTLKELPIHGVHIDMTRNPEQLSPALNSISKEQYLSLGLINGRNIWRTDLEWALRHIETAKNKIGPERIIISSSCSFLHCPFSMKTETKIDPEIHSWMCFAEEKLNELNLLRIAANEGRAAIQDELADNQNRIHARKVSVKVNNPRVQAQVRQIDGSMLCRKRPYGERKVAQQETLKLPILPTTTIGSFPQTPEVRGWRRDWRSGKMSVDDYTQSLKNEMRRCIAFQEEIGLDVLVHGEFERNDMVEYFGEELEGFVFTLNGWVQSYGSRCVKPPVIYGDVERKSPMTVAWSSYAQSLTEKPVKGILTGPVTILQWSFVRDDQPREDTCRQIALVLRREVSDLEKAGICIIQIDEPALREGLPLKSTSWGAYLHWGVDCFRLASCAVGDETQIHTHMCYGDFEDIIEAIIALDADVISIEASRSGMNLLKGFSNNKYPNDIGPGVYDIHSPLVPSRTDIDSLLKKAMEVIPAAQLWVNPDCGLKTRRWEEVRFALKNMVEATQEIRKELISENR